MILFATYIRQTFLLDKSDIFFHNIFLFISALIICISIYLDCIQNALVWIAGVSLWSDNDLKRNEKRQNAFSVKLIVKEKPFVI